MGDANSNPSPHLRALDGLRALAALYVVVFHALGEAPPAALTHGWPRLLHGVFQYGHDAVDLFIVLSGFCLMLPVIAEGGTLRGGALGFFARRARRILPAYFLTLAGGGGRRAGLISGKTGTVWDCAIPITARGLLAHVCLVQDAFGDTINQINHSLWSISVEWRIYFVFPALVWGWRQAGPWKTTTAALLCSFLLAVMLPRTGLNADLRGETGLMPQYLSLFTFGMLGATLAGHRRPAAFGWAAVVLFGATLILAPLKIWHGMTLPVAALDVPVGLAAMCLLVAAAQPGPLCRFLSARPLASAGTFAYSLYLLHAPLLQVLWQYAFHPLGLGPALTLLLQCILGLPIIVAASYLFSLLAERPFLRRAPTHVVEDGAAEALPRAA